MRVATVFLAVFLAVVAAGCSAIQQSELRSMTPSLLPTASFEEAAAAVYDEVFLLAFERGYQIIYASREELLVEIDLPTKNTNLLGTDWVHRVAMLVRDKAGKSMVHTRYHSYDPEDGNLRVVSEDREVALAFFTALTERLTPVAAP